MDQLKGARQPLNHRESQPWSRAGGLWLRVSKPPPLLSHTNPIHSPSTSPFCVGIGESRKSRSGSIGSTSGAFSLTSMGGRTRSMSSLHRYSARRIHRQVWPVDVAALALQSFDRADRLPSPPRPRADRGVVRSDPRNGRVEREERLLPQRRRRLRAEADGQQGLMHADAATGGGPPAPSLLTCAGRLDQPRPLPRLPLGDRRTTTALPTTSCPPGRAHRLRDRRGPA